MNWHGTTLEGDYRGLGRRPGDECANATLNALAGVAGSAQSRAAVLIASKDGEGTIADTVRSAVDQCDVYVVSDGSTDGTAEAAWEAGATVLDLPVNVGKPAAIYAAVHQLGLLDTYEFLSILDDDTVIAPDFIAECLRRMTTDRRQADKPYPTERRSGDRRGRHEPVPRERRSGTVVITVGKTITNWTHETRWNPWVAARAYGYWRYQVTIRPGQNAFNALNCISGSNSMYRAQLLKQVLVERTPYIVDDTYWVLETQRRQLGRVLYVPEAEALIQDPTTFRDWYKQNLRWLWGTCQGIVGHHAGRRRSWFDFWYGTLMIDWLLYIFLWPTVLAVVLVTGTFRPGALALGVAGVYTAWAAAASIALKKWRLVLFTPFIVVFDWLYRVNFVHAIIKTAREPTVTSCRWESPTRYQQNEGR